MGSGRDGKCILWDEECRVGFHRISQRWIKIFTRVEGKIEFTCSKPSLDFFFSPSLDFHCYLISFLDAFQAGQNR